MKKKKKRLSAKANKTGQCNDSLCLFFLKKGQGDKLDQNRSQMKELQKHSKVIKYLKEK